MAADPYRPHPQQRIGTYYRVFPTFNQGRKVLWDGRNRDGMPFLDHFPRDLITSKHEQEMQIELVNGSIWQIVGSDRIDNLVATNPIGCVFSEYAIQRPQAWEFLRPILRENGGWAVFCFTPRGRNHGWDLYQRALSDPAWFCELLTVRDTRRDAPGEDGQPIITDADIERERREGMPEPLVQQEYYCSFEAGSALQFIPGEVIERALAREAIGYDWAPKVVGVDVGRNRDRSVITIRQGGRILERLVLRPEAMRSNPTATIGGHLAQVIRVHQPSAVFVDAVGIGGPLCDYMQTLGYRVIPVLGNSQPTNPRYFNLRAEMWGNLRDWLMDRGCLERERDRTLIAELQLPEIRFKRDKEWLTPKDELEADEDLESFVSPDEADSPALTFAAPVTMQASTAGAQPQIAATDWDPRSYDPPTFQRPSHDWNPLTWDR